MEVILRQDIEKLGTRGQIVNVADGYARNYLFPRKLAVPATEANKKSSSRSGWRRCGARPARRPRPRSWRACWPASP
jgi:large subunit ribosomal protein L9